MLNLLNKKKMSRSILEEEQMQSPLRTALKTLGQNKIAMGSVIVFVAIFLMCFILPIWFSQPLSYQDPTQKDIAPGKNFLSMPSQIKNNAKEIGVGPTFGAGIDKDGVVYEWGTMDELLKAMPPDMGKVTDISVGQDHVLALNSKGKLFTWGFDRFGLSQIPSELQNKKIRYIGAGYQASVAVTDDGKIYKWGNDNTVDILPSNADGMDVKSVAMNSQTGLALTEDGKVIPLSRRGTSFDTVPKDIQGKVKSLALSEKSAAAVLNDGTVAVWGGNKGNAGRIPDGIQGNAVSVTAGKDFFTVLLKDNTVRAWGGSNMNGQLKVPSGLKNVVSVSSNYYQTYAIDKNGHAKAWGLKGYLFGTDDTGRSVALRMLQGGRMTMTVGFVSVIISLFIGIIVGGISGYYAGSVDIFLMRVGEVVGSLPFIPLALILSALVGNKVSEIGRIVMIMVILGVLSWPSVAYLVRGQVLAERGKEFVTAAKALGVKERSIIFKHIVPNIMTIIIVNATLAFATCMLTESGLSFLGFGVSEPFASWGNMLNNCRSSDVIAMYWWRWVFPSIALGLCTVSINLFGDGLRKAIDPKSQER